MKRERKQLQRGFTLIEALAAIAVMMIIIPVLLQGFTIAGGIAANTRNTADATALAQSTMDEILATQAWQTGTSGGEAYVGPTHYTWSSELGNFDSEPNVQTLSVTVYWANRGTRQEVKLTSVVYIPGSTVSSTSGPTLGARLP